MKEYSCNPSQKQEAHELEASMGYNPASKKERQAKNWLINFGQIII
jgi:hypothetical protein